MIKTYHIFLAAVSLFWSTMAIAQKKPDKTSDVTIHIFAGITFCEDLHLWIDIERRSGEIKINYKIQDSLDFTGFKNDTGRQALQKIYNNYASADTNKALLFKKLMSYLDKYKRYYTDSIQLNAERYAAYSRSLTKIARSSKRELETDKENTIMDGDFMQCSIISEGQTKVITGEAELWVTRPVIYRLMKRTLDLARDEKHPTILKIHQKFGY